MSLSKKWKLIRYLLTSGLNKVTVLGISFSSSSDCAGTEEDVVEVVPEVAVFLNCRATLTPWPVRIECKGSAACSNIGRNIGPSGLSLAQSLNQNILKPKNFEKIGSITCSWLLWANQEYAVEFPCQPEWSPGHDWSYYSCARVSCTFPFWRRHQIAVEQPPGNHPLRAPLILVWWSHLVRQELCLSDDICRHRHCQRTIPGHSKQFLYAKHHRNVFLFDVMRYFEYFHFQKQYFYL